MSKWIAHNYSNLSFKYGVKQVLKHRNEEYVPSGSAQVAVLSGIAFWNKLLLYW